VKRGDLLRHLGTVLICPQLGSQGRKLGHLRDDQFASVANVATVLLWDRSISRLYIVIYQSMARIIWVASYSASMSSSSANREFRKVAAGCVCYNDYLRNPIRHSYGKSFCSEDRTHNFTLIRLRIDRSLARVKLTPND
jgi:hypothetical protein